MEKLDPQYDRKRGLMESDEAYAARMERLDKREAFFAKLIETIPVREPKNDR